jgi:hypothetical protein
MRNRGSRTFRPGAPTHARRQHHDAGLQPVHCKRCRHNNKIPTRAFADGIVTVAPRSPSSARSRAEVVRRVVSARRVDRDMTAELELAAQTREIERMTAHVVRTLDRRHADRVIDETVIPPSRLPAMRDEGMSAPLDLDGKQPAAMRFAGRPRKMAAVPRRSGPVDPLMPPGGPCCQVCAFQRRRDRAGHFALAVVEALLTGEGLLLLYWAHGREIEWDGRRDGVTVRMRYIGKHPEADPEVCCGGCGAKLDRPGSCPSAVRCGSTGRSAGSPAAELRECAFRFSRRGCPLCPL